MKQPVDLGRRFLALADRDIRTLQLLISAADSDDQAVGFHAQQAVEKCLKAVLSKKNIAFRKTHDLVELFDLIRDQPGSVPPNAESLEMLNPFAVTWRYDLFEAEPVDRDWIATSVQGLGSGLKQKSKVVSIRTPTGNPAADLAVENEGSGGEQFRVEIALCPYFFWGVDGILL